MLSLHEVQEQNDSVEEVVATLCVIKSKVRIHMCVCDVTNTRKRGSAKLQIYKATSVSVIKYIQKTYKTKSYLKLNLEFTPNNNSR